MAQKQLAIIMDLWKNDLNNVSSESFKNVTLFNSVFRLANEDELVKCHHAVGSL
jgi:hypothetical protein